MSHSPETQGLPRPKGLGSAELVQALYQDLRRIAAAKVSKLPPGQTLQATALVHEAFLRMDANCSAEWQNEGHFFAAVAEAMRRILVDQARCKAAIRNGGGLERESFAEGEVSIGEPDDRILEVHEALDELEKEDAVRAQVVKLRFFAGLKHAEIATLLGASEKTVRRHWSFAKIWLFEKISKKNQIV